jgi:hypothetical protein
MLSVSAAAGSIVAALATRCRGPLITTLMSASARSLASTPLAQPPEQRISEELLAQVQDHGLLRTAGFIDGKWSQASNGATFEVMSTLNLRTGTYLGPFHQRRACCTRR